MDLHKKVKRKLKQIITIFKTRKKLSRLYNSSSLSAKSLANLIRATLFNQISAEEKVWVDRIESLRRKVNSSTSEIIVKDFGVESTDKILTDKEVRRGRNKTWILGNLCEIASKPYFWSLFLFKLIREFKPTVCLELGTCLGISAAYQAAALALNKSGRIVTLEGADSLASLSKEHFHTLGLENIDVVVGRFQDTLDTTLEELGTIDYAFIDGHHDESATVEYFEKLFPFLSEKALVVFDDISWTKGMKRAWNTIISDKRIQLSIDLSSVGLCIIDSDMEEKRNYRIPMM